MRFTVVVPLMAAVVASGCGSGGGGSSVSASSIGGSASSGTTGSTSTAGTASSGTSSGSTGSQGGYTAHTLGVAPPLSEPGALTTDLQGNLYVADNGVRIVKVAPTGAATTLTTDCDTCGSGVNFGNALAIDTSGNLYQADSAAVLEISPIGKVTTFAGDKLGGSTLVNAVGVAVDASGNVYAADNANSEVYKISASGSISSFASITSPVAIAVDPSANVFVVGGQASNEIYEVNASGKVSPYAACTLNGGGDSCELSTLVVGSDGTLYALDSTAMTVGLVPPSGGAMTVLFSLLSLSGGGTPGGGMTVDASGDLFFTGDGPPSILEEQLTK